MSYMRRWFVRLRQMAAAMRFTWVLWSCRTLYIPNDMPVLIPLMSWEALERAGHLP